jgi:2-oxoglutarate ferredoxin oxidoreductase subunit alpha
MERLKKKHATAKQYVPAPFVHETRGAQVGIIAYGSTESAVQEARAQLAEAGLKSSLMRIRSLPFTKEVDKFIKKYEQVIVVEMNRDGQMYQLLCMDYPALAPKLRSVAFQDGLPASAKWIREGILKFAKPAGKKKVAVKKTKKTVVKKGAKK